MTTNADYNVKNQDECERALFAEYAETRRAYNFSVGTFEGWRLLWRANAQRRNEWRQCHGNITCCPTC